MIKSNGLEHWLTLDEVLAVIFSQGVATELTPIKDFFKVSKEEPICKYFKQHIVFAGIMKMLAYSDTRDQNCKWTTEMPSIKTSAFRFFSMLRQAKNKEWVEERKDFLVNLFDKFMANLV